MSKRLMKKQTADVGAEKVRLQFTNLLIIVMLTSITVFPFIFDSFTAPKLAVASFGLLVFSIQLLKQVNNVYSNRIPYSLLGLILLYSIALLVAWSKSDIPFIRAAFGQFGRGNGLFYYFFTILILIFSVKFSTISSGFKAHQLLTYFSFFLSFYATFQKIGIDVAKLDTRGISPVVLTYGNSNFAGGMLSALFTYHFIYMVKSKKINVQTAFLLLVLLISTTFAAAIQGYFLIFLALALGLSLYVIQQVKSKLLLNFTLITWFLGFTFIILGLQGKSFLASIFARTSFQARIEYWRIAIEVIRDYPFFGVGPDKLFDVSSNYMSPGSLKIITLTRMDNAHNWYLNIASNFGVLSLIFLLAIFAWVFVAGFQLIKKRDTSDSFPVALFAGFMAMFIDGLVSIEQPGIGVWLYFFGGATIGSFLSARKSNSVFNGKSTPIPKQTSLKKSPQFTVLIVLITVLAFSTAVTAIRIFQDASLRNQVQTQLLGLGDESTLDSIESITVSLRAEPEYAIQSIPPLATLGDRRRIDTISQAVYDYNKSSIQATLLRADVLKALGRIEESCPLRITLINNTPWDLNQLAPYLDCIVNGMKDSNSIQTLKRVSRYLPNDETSEILKDNNEINVLLSRFQKFAIISRLNYLIGNESKASQERDYAFALLSRITELEKAAGSIQDEALRTNLLKLLDFNQE